MLPRVFLMLAICLLLTGCAVQRIVNKVMLVHSIGFDTSDSGVKGTVIIDDFKKKGESEKLLFVTESPAIDDIMPKISAKTKEPIETGQLGIVVFGKSMSQKGIFPTLQYLSKDVKIPSFVVLMVAETDASKIMEILRHSREPYLLSEQIEQNTWNGNLPVTNLHVTNFNYYSEGSDMFLPYIRLDGGELIADGLALFKDDKFITKIDMKDALLLKMLLENAKNGKCLVPIHGLGVQDETILLQITGSKVSYDVGHTDSIPSVSIKLRLEAKTNNRKGEIDLTSKEVIAKLNTMTGAYFEEQIQSFLSLCKKKNVDPVGFGDLIKSRSKTWNARAFEEVYPNLKTNVNVKMRIVQTGLID